MTFVSDVSEALRCSRSPAPAAGSFSVLVALASLGLGLTADPASAANDVKYVDDPFPPVTGVVLPETPSGADRIVYRRSLGRTFQNECFPIGYSGPASVSVDVTNRIVRLDFDESNATPTPFCPAVFLPVSFVQLELDPLPPGHWTLEVDRMLSAYLFGSIAPTTVAFEVAATGGAAVPTAGVPALLTLLVGALSIARARLRASR